MSHQYDQYEKIEKSLQYICMSGIMSNSSPRFDYDDWITVRHILRIRFIMAEKKETSNWTNIHWNWKDYFWLCMTARLFKWWLTKTSMFDNIWIVMNNSSGSSSEILIGHTIHTTEDWLRQYLFRNQQTSEQAIVTSYSVWPQSIWSPRKSRMHWTKFVHSMVKHASIHEK